MVQKNNRRRGASAAEGKAWPGFAAGALRDGKPRFAALAPSSALWRRTGRGEILSLTAGVHPVYACAIVAVDGVKSYKARLISRALWNDLLYFNDGGFAGFSVQHVHGTTQSRVK